MSQTQYPNWIPQNFHYQDNRQLSSTYPDGCTAIYQKPKTTTLETNTAKRALQSVDRQDNRMDSNGPLIELLCKELILYINKVLLILHTVALGLKFYHGHSLL